MHQHPEASVGVTNGYRRRPGGDSLALRGLAAVERDPLLALLQENWLASCSGIFRTQDLDPSIFGSIPAYLEWTWFAFMIVSAGRRVVTLDTPTFRIHETAGSLSRSREYERRAVAVLTEMLDRVSRPDLRRLLKRRLAEGWHSRSDTALRSGQRGEALKCHLQSLRYLRDGAFCPIFPTSATAVAKGDALVAPVADRG